MTTNSLQPVPTVVSPVKSLPLGLVRTKQKKDHKVLTWYEDSLSGGYTVASRAEATLTKAGSPGDGLAPLGSNLTWPHHTHVALGELLPLRVSASLSVKSTYCVLTELQALDWENSRNVIWSLLRLKDFM